MELTNHSYLETRRNYLSAYSDRKIASDRISTGNRLESDKHDLGAIGVAAKLNSYRIQDLAEKTNLQNFNTFLQTQMDGIDSARNIYSRMEMLANKALDPAISQSDMELLNKEFSELSEDLTQIINSEMNGQRLFGGRFADFTDGLLDTNATGATPQKTSIDVSTTKGTMTIELSPGHAADQIWMFQGELPTELDEYFNSSTYYHTNARKADDVARLNELNSKLYSHFETHGIFTTGPWQTQGNASAGNFDTFNVKFDSCNVELTTKFHENNGAYGESLYNSLVGSNELRINEDGPPGDSTIITMIGVNAGNTAVYDVRASFEPDLPYNDIDIPGSNDVYPALSFGTIDCAKIDSKESAQSILLSITTELENLTDSMAQVAAFQGRIEKQIEHLSSNGVSYESAVGRIEDTDFAREATALAKSSVKTEMAAHMLSKSARLKDVLIPLTTDHFRSHVLNSRI